jgi:uncharacterized membrane protein YfcA
MQPIVRRPRTPHRPRKLNIGRIKTVIVTSVSAATAVGSACTGLGPQTALAPAMTWMLGTPTEKAQGTAMRATGWMVAAAVVGVIGAGHPSAATWPRAVLLFVCATIGALVGAPISRALAGLTARRLGLSLGIMATLYFLLDNFHRGMFDVHRANPVSVASFAGVGLLAGCLTQAMGLPAGLLMVPGIFYFGHTSALDATFLSLLVIGLASLLPAATYVRQGLVDTRYTLSVCVGAISGGVAGGVFSQRLNERAIIAAFVLIGMFLCARELARISRSHAGDQPTATVL